MTLVKRFYQVLLNTLLANITTGYIWSALTFWLYLETRSVLATGLVGGAYMLLVALCSIPFGTVVDHYKKRSVMVFAALFTLGAFTIAGLLYLMTLAGKPLSIADPTVWLFAAIILAGAVVENMRNIALSTTVTLLVDEDKRANANGMVGAVQGVGFILASVFSGLSIGMLGMGWTLVITLVLTAVAAVHMIFVQIPEQGIAHDPELANKRVDIRGSIAAIVAVPGLFALLIFSTFNNLIGGVYMALMDPYGLTLFPVEVWGIVFGMTGTGFIVGGMLVARFGLGKNPVKTLLIAAVVMGLIGALFTIRELWWLYAIGIWLYMVLIPAMEAAEQTIIQRVVPYKRQGRVFGFAQALESATAPVTAFLIAPIAEFAIIPYMNTPTGQQQFKWLLGEGDARAIALLFLVAGLIVALAALFAFTTRSYRHLSASYARTAAQP